jgi:RimJ/RimL family protein N-acetyltransferase
MTPTPYPELNAVLDRLVAEIRDALGDVFVGAYLQGSFAVGDFDRLSDVDFIVAVAEELSDDHVRALQAAHARVYGLACVWAQHLEGSYFPLHVLRRCDRRGRPLWYLNHGAWSLVRDGHCNTAVVRWIVREHGVVLAGPSPETLVDPVPTEVLREEILATIRDWGQEVLSEPERFSNRFYQGFIVLSYCRMPHDLHTGRVGSKREGAEWAKATLDPSWSGLIDRAWDTRPNPALSVRQPADPEEFERTLEFVRHMIEETAHLDIAAGGAGTEPAARDRPVDDARSPAERNRPGTAIIAETDRIALRPFEPADLGELAEILADPEVMRFSGGGPWSRERTKRFIQGCVEDYSEERWGFGLWAVVHKEDARLIGYCGLSRFDDVDGAPEVEIGYRLSREYWGRGLATEAARAVRDYAFSRLGLKRLISMIERENTASIRVAEKIGMTCEKEIRKWDRLVLVYAVSEARAPDGTERAPR